MSGLAHRLIEKNKQTKATFLDLGNCGLIDLPDELIDCVWLERLNLGETYRDEDDENVYTANSGKPNQLSAVALARLVHLVNLRSLFLRRTSVYALHALQALVNLEELSVSYNYITDLRPLAALQQLQRLYIGNNQISDLSPLQALPRLQRLYAGYNHLSDVSPISGLTELQKLVLAYNRVNNLKPLETMQGLQALILSGNGISDIASLAKLQMLEKLNLAFNNITNLLPLRGLHQLERLDLAGNRVTDPAPLQELTRLKELILTDNAISRVEEEWINAMQKLEDLYLVGNPIQNIPAEIYNQFNCYQDIKNFFKDRQNGSIPVYEAKVILVGNGRVGKTCLVKRLADNTFNAGEPSTHAIQLRQWELSELATELGVKHVKVNLWDFGGQDIYHATHRLFLNTKALFILVWDKQTQAEPVQSETLPNGRVLTYQNHSLFY